MSKDDGRYLCSYVCTQSATWHKHRHEVTLWVFDLDRVVKNQNIVSKIPCAMMEFCGRSVFTQNEHHPLLKRILKDMYHQDQLLHTAHPIKHCMDTYGHLLLKHVVHRWPITIPNKTNKAHVSHIPATHVFFFYYI